MESTIPRTQEESHYEWESLVLDKGYKPVYFDGLNRFYVSEAHSELEVAFSTPPNCFDDFVFSAEPPHFLCRLVEQQAEARAAQSEAKAQQAELALNKIRNTKSYRFFKMDLSGVKENSKCPYVSGML